MNADILQKKYDKLLAKVRQMRGAQKAYFQFRAGADLQTAKRLEREIDSIIIEETRIQQQNQKENP